uniref:YFamide neuropeptide n=1 Tax=Platynereis dumerilii TaxID=6359 RepID=F8UKU2_PLADU|nr:YFamide neuropeptide precursor [Platynereis dumerilii]
MNQVGLILTVLSLSSSLLIHATQDEALNGELQDRSSRVARSPDVDSEKRYPNTVLFGKRAPLFKFGKRRQFMFGKRQDEEDAMDEGYDTDMMAEKRYFGKMPVGSLYKGDKRYYPTDQRHVTLEDLMERENRKFYFGKRTDDAAAADIRGDRKFFLGKRDDLDEEKRKMVYFGKRMEDPEMDKRRMVYFGKREPNADMMDEEKRKMVYFGKRDPTEEKRKMVYFGKREPGQTEEEKRKMVYFGKRTDGDKSSR